MCAIPRLGNIVGDQYIHASTMKKNKKIYAMQRMGSALERAIAATSIAEKDRGARWAAAWGMLDGIPNTAVRLARRL